ncbi:MAG TPA: tetratricopeptide repeat protein [Gemmatimonadaceae bacterium]|nr:tetratricopeptide repeat protein [Gemmatimonadaceae bacterium]
MMTPERWTAVQALLYEAIEREPAARQAYLDAACEGDAALRREVDELLAAHERPGALDALASRVVAPLVADLRTPSPAHTPQLPRYTALERLGDGGMGVVYRARDARLDRTVALKFLPPHLSSASDAKARFLAEAQAAAALEHPNICTIYEVGETQDGQLYIAMPYYDGETLAGRIARGPLPLAEALAIALDVAHGLGRAHERGIVHRDIKPANIMITADGLVKILDFGIAKLSGANVTQPGARLGTVAYMSPEQARGASVDHRTDIWSLGVVLYEMLAASRPFSGDDERAILYAIQSGDAAPLSMHRDDVPAALDGVAARALAKRPEDRFPSMRAFSDELASLQAVLASAVRAVPRPHSAPRTAGRPPLSLDDERRQVTVLVAVLAGYPSLIERCPPDEVEWVISRVRTVAVDVMRRHGGSIEELRGDQLRALFGMPEMHEDDAVRAARAALALHRAVREIAASTADGPARSIRMQSGVHAGPVVVQHSRRHGGIAQVAGAAVHGATRLAALATPDAILVSPECQRLIAPFFDVQACAPVMLDAGASPITPYRVAGESGLQTRLDAAARTGLTPYTGRGAELDALHSRLDRARRGEGQFVAVVGEAGAGKSRLLYELHRRVDGDDTRVLRGRCQSYGGTTPYLPFIEALRDMLQLDARLRRDDAVEVTATRIRAVDPSLDGYIPLYLHLLSMQSDAYPLPRHLQGERFQAAMLDALVAIFTLHAAQHATLVLFEDWHWVDDASRDVLRQLVAILPTYPLLVVASCRPDDAIDWGSADHQTTIRLGPLDRDASVAIMSAVLHAECIAPPLARQIHDRTAGNPFFLEEVCQTLLEEGTVTVTAGEATATDASGAVQFPETVQAVIRTRLDRLERNEREVLRVASVIGREFSRDVLEHVLAGAIDPSRPLERLRSAGLIQQTSVVPAPSYRFKHVLTQEVTYETLLEHQRRTLHGAVGRVLERRHPERVEERLELLAHHFSRAELWRDAVQYGMRAAKRAADLSQFSDALGTLERAQAWLRHLDDDADRRDLVGEILLRQERLCETLGLRGRQQRLVDELIALLAPAGASAKLAEAYLRQGDVYTLLKHFDAANRALETALRITRERGDAAGERNALRSIGLLRWHEGNDAEALAYTENALAIDRERADIHAVAGDLSNLGIILKNMGEYDRARVVLEEALELPVVNEDPLKRSFVVHNLANLHRALGQTEQALAYLRRGDELAREPKLPIQRSFHLTAIAHIYLQMGMVEESLRVYREAVELSRKAHHADGLAQELRMLGELLYGLGRYTEALPLFTEGTGLFAQLEDHESEAFMWSRIAAIRERDSAVADAAEAWEHARALHRRVEDAPAELEALEGLARCTRRQTEDAESAIPIYEEAIALAAARGEQRREGSMRNQLGILHWERGRYAEALRQYEAAVRVFRDLGDLVHEGLMLNSLGVTLCRLRRYEEARTVLEQGLAVNRQSAQRLLQAHSLAALGEVYFAIGRLDEAAEHYEGALALRRELHDGPGEGWMLHYLGGVRSAQGAHAEAERCAMLARQRAEDMGDAALLAACGARSAHAAPAHQHTPTRE